MRVKIRRSKLFARPEGRCCKLKVKVVGGENEVSEIKNAVIDCVQNLIKKIREKDPERKVRLDIYG